MPPNCTIVLFEKVGIVPPQAAASLNNAGLEASCVPVIVDCAAAEPANIAAETNIGVIFFINTFRF